MNNKLSKSVSIYLACFIFTFSQAQDNYAKHQLFAGYGIGYTNEVFTELGTAFNIDFLQAIFSDSTNQSTVMPVYIGYRYFLRKHLGMGFNLAYPLMNNEDNHNIQSKTAYKQQFQVLIFLPRTDVVYINKKNFCLYSGIGVGIIIENKDAVEAGEANIAPAYHITALGFSMGKMVGLFTEFGYGVNGIVSLGIVTKFGGEDLRKENDVENKSSKKKGFAEPCIRL